MNAPRTGNAPVPADAPAQTDDAPEVLRDPGFRRLWIANSLRDTAGGIAEFSLPVTALLLLHAQPWAMSLITVCSRLGYLLFGLPAGAWIDRWRKRSVLLWADAAYAAAFLSIPIAYELGWLRVQQLFVVAFTVSVAGVFFDVAHTSILPLLLTRRRVADANARLQTSDNTIQAVSPSLSGVLAQTVAAPLLYGAAAALHLLSALTVRRVRPVEEPVRPADPGRGRLGREITEGLRFLFGQPLLRLLVAQGAWNNLGAGAIIAVMPVFLLRELGMAPWLYGLLSTLGATSGIVSSLVCPPLRRRMGEIRMTLLFSALAPFAVVAAPLADVFHSGATVLVGAAQILISFVIVGRSIAAAGLRARVTPNAYMGRVAAAAGVVTQGTTPLGALLGGLVATEVSSTAALWVGVAVMAVPLALLLRSPLRSHRRLPVEWEQA